MTPYYVLKSKVLHISLISQNKACTQMHIVRVKSRQAVVCVFRSLLLSVRLMLLCIEKATATIANLFQGFDQLHIYMSSGYFKDLGSFDISSSSS